MSLKYQSVNFSLYFCKNLSASCAPHIALAEWQNNYGRTRITHYWQLV